MGASRRTAGGLPFGLLTACPCPDSRQRVPAVARADRLSSARGTCMPAGLGDPGSALFPAMESPDEVGTGQNILLHDWLTDLLCPRPGAGRHAADSPAGRSGGISHGADADRQNPADRLHHERLPDVRIHAPAVPLRCPLLSPGDLVPMRNHVLCRRHFFRRYPCPAGRALSEHLPVYYCGVLPDGHAPVRFLRRSELLLRARHRLPCRCAGASFP